MDEEQKLKNDLTQKGVTRRQFLKFCGVVAGALGLDPSFGSRIYEAFAADTRPCILWLHFAECTGCTESALRTSSPFFDDLIMDKVSLDYHITVMAGAGETVESILFNSAKANAGRFFCVVEGAIPTADGGVYGMVGGRTMLSIANEVCPKAKAILALGNCASFGGLPAALPNPTGAKGVKAALGTALSVPVVNIPGCPPNPVSFVGTIANYLLFGKLPDLDTLGRPLFAYGKTVHDQCPNKAADLKYKCLKPVGCKGPRSRNNCPSVKFNMGTNWPVEAGHPCIGCSEPDFWDKMTPFYTEPK